MNFQLSKSSKSNREGIDPMLIKLDDLAITLTLIDYGHGKHAGLREAEDQNELYLDEKSNADGYVVISDHQLGMALDFYAYVDGKASWKHEHLAVVALAYFQAAMILGYKIGWGGHFKRKTPKYVNGIPYGWDCPHIYLIK